LVGGGEMVREENGVLYIYRKNPVGSGGMEEGMQGFLNRKP